jgi:type II secretory pathway pseudopilin PulG
MIFIKKKLRAFSLVELILAIGIFATVSSMLILLVVDSSRTLKNTKTRSEATYLIQEINSALLLLKKQSWLNITENTNGGQKHIQFLSDTYQIVDGPSTYGKLNYYFTISEAERDEEGNLVETGGETDFHTRLVSITISWKDSLGKEQTINPQIYLNDWQTYSIFATTVEDFNKGIHNNTITVDDGDGEIILQSRYYSDWCNPEATINEYDIPGEATPRSVFSLLGKSYLGTRGSSNGQPFTKLLIEGVDPPELSVEGYFSGYNVNDIFVTGDYAFLATTNDSKEVVILDVSSLPYTEVGYYNAPDTYDAYSVFVDGDIGYLGQGRYLRSFDLSSYTGPRSSIGSKDLATWLFKWSATVSQIYSKDNYVYAVLDWDWYELAIVDVSNPSNMIITSQTSVNNQQVYDMKLSEDGNRAYFGTTESGSEHEIFIIDTSSKNGSRPVISSIDSFGTTIRGIEVVEDENILIAVGTGGEEYQVYNITDKNNPIKCGGMNVNNGVYDIDSIRDPQTNAFSYIVTGDINSEFKIIRGGPGEGGTDGYGYYENGEYLSEIYDTESENSRYYTLTTTTNVPTNTTLKFQVRASNNIDMSSSEWEGPDGSSSTYYEGSEMYRLENGLIGRYFQYRILFSSDIENSPLFEEITINYEK